METDTIYFNDITDSDWMALVRARNNEASTFWNQEQELKKVREENIKMYLLKWVNDMVLDPRYQDVYADSRQFTAIRTILPFLTARIMRPEVVPANSTDIAQTFASDFEEVLLRVVERQYGRGKIRLAVQDLLKGERVGILKWRYDRARNKIVLDHIKPSACIIGKRSKLYEELDYFSHTIERSIGDLLEMFPDKEQQILNHYHVDKNDVVALDEVKHIEEEWIWISVKGKATLTVGWRDHNFCFGKIKDPNWDENGRNVTEHPMVPVVLFNVLNDGSGYIDETSYMEQSMYLQKNYDRRGQTIAESARYGGVGTPIFAKGAIQQKDVAKVKFSPVQRILLDTQDVGKAFTTWKAEPIPNYIIEDKYDERNSIDNIWGSPNIFRGEQTKNNTLGQDIMVRDNAEGRQGDIIDCIEDAMQRFYQIEAQMLYRYMDERQFYNYYGNNGKFVSVVISNTDIAKNLGIEIGVKAHSNLPIDRSQQRATLVELIKANKVGTFTAYKELGIFEDPEEAYKEYVMEQLDPQAQLAEIDKQVFDREANQDLMMVIAGSEPDEREDISEQYIQYLTQWLESDKYAMLQRSKPRAAERVSQFMDKVVAKAERKVNKLAMQPEPEMPQPGMPAPPGMLPGQQPATPQQQLAAAMPAS